MCVGDADVCGPYISGRGMDCLNNMNERTKESRAHILGWCEMHRLAILNSQFSKPADKLITYREKTIMIQILDRHSMLRDALKSISLVDLQRLEILMRECTEPKRHRV